MEMRKKLDRAIGSLCTRQTLINTVCQCKSGSVISVFSLDTGHILMQSLKGVSVLIRGAGRPFYEFLSRARLSVSTLSPS